MLSDFFLAFSRFFYLTITLGGFEDAREDGGFTTDSDCFYDCCLNDLRCGLCVFVYAETE